MKHLLPALLLAAATLPVATQSESGILITIEGGVPRASERCGAQEADFILHAERPLTLVQRTITGWNKGRFTYGTSTSGAMQRGDTQTINTCISETMPTLEICATPDGGQEQCWTPAYSGRNGALMLTAGFALAAAASAPLDAAALQGAWDERVSGRCHMLITRTKGNEVQVRVNWADGAAVDNVWTFSGRWDKAQQQLAYTDGLRVRREDSGKTTTETVQWSEGAGTLRHAGGALYWHDAKEHICKECIFQRAQ